MRKYILWIIGIILFYNSYAQKENKWQDYLSFLNATNVSISTNKIFCATEGGLFYYNLEDNSINKLSGVNGLSDFGINTIAYSEEKEVLVVAYENSNIDLIYDSEIINIPDIKRKQLTGDKTIYNITFINNYAYLSCGFGIVVLNLDRREVKDTYFIGPGGSFIRINDVESDGQYLYAASNEGIYRADLNSPNLLDYQNWVKIETIPHANEKFNHLMFFAGKLIANYTPNEYNQDIMYQLNGNAWSEYLPSIKFIFDAQVNQNYLIIASRSETFVIDANNVIIGKISTYNFEEQNLNPVFPRSAGISQDGSLWIADYTIGMVRLSGQNFEMVYPGGPLDNQIFSLYSNNGDLWITPGGRTDAWVNTWQKPRFQLFRSDEWKSFSKIQFSEMDDFFDVVCVTADPNDPDHIFAGSWGGGLLEFQGDQFLNRFTNKNSPLETALPQQPDAPYVRIGGMDFDSQGNLWLTNSEVAKNLVKRSPSGDWESFVLPDVASQRNIGKLIVTRKDDKWIIIPRGHDLYVVDKSGSETRHLPVTAYFNNGTYEEFNRMNDVYSIAEDNEGDIWVGTSKGIAVFASPERIWQTENYYATQPSLDLNDGIFHPLLETETVTAIAVDGGNRKWLGTKNSGVYLISETGDTELLHFTKENSPLLSNTINDIAINEKNGEVFFGTDEGLISFKGDAIGGKDAYENVYVYPNPIRETYDGPVTITGLIENTDIKITDISGNLVFNTQSLGGQAIWDGNNLNGNRVRTGVYLVFCTNEDGSQTHITKLLFIN